MGSTRLPGKVLMTAAGKTMLEHQMERMMRATLANAIVIATTTDPQDDALAALAAEKGYNVFRGHPTDLLDRHYKAGLAYNADIVVKIPSDCPLIDPAIIDKVLAFYLENPGEWDFVSNLHPPTWPDGNDVEIMPIHLLRQACQEAQKNHEREHTTPWFWDNPWRWRIGNVQWESGLNYSMSHRWTLDYPEDYQFLKAVFEALYPQNPNFTLQDILQLCLEHPEIKALNNRYAGVNWYRHHLNELNTVDEQDTRTTA
jgi:spore coat polysaccharide biosynthesis protein SpsF